MSSVGHLGLALDVIVFSPVRFTRRKRCSLTPRRHAQVRMPGRGGIRGGHDSTNQPTAADPGGGPRGPWPPPSLLKLVIKKDRHHLRWLIFRISCPRPLIILDPLLLRNKFYTIRGSDPATMFKMLLEKVVWFHNLNKWH